MLTDTLGVGGLSEQVKATDRQQKTLLMYATRCKDFAVFKQSTELVHACLSKDDVVIHFREQDSAGRNLLHHAADAGDDQVLAKVMANKSSDDRANILYEYSYIAWPSV